MKLEISSTWLHSLFVMFSLTLHFGVLAQSSPSNDVTAVRNEFNKMVAAFNTRDAKAIISYFDQQTILVHPLRGEAAYDEIKTGFEERYSKPTNYNYTVLTNIEEIQTSGDLAMMRIIWLRQIGADGEIVPNEKDIEIWKRQPDGGWKLLRGYSFPIKKESPNWAQSGPSAAIPPKSVSKKARPRKRDSRQDGNAIKAQLEKLTRAYNNRDPETAISVYAADSLLTHAGIADADRETNRQGYAERMKSAPAEPITIANTLEEIQVSGDLAFARLTWTVTRNSDGKLLSKDKDLEIWQRQNDGTWKLVRGISFYLKLTADKPVSNNTLQPKEFRKVELTGEMKNMFLGLQTVIYSVPDVNRGKEWYSKVLGMKPYFDQPFYVGFNVGGYELGLSPNDSKIVQGNNAIAYWGVKEIQKSHERLLELGAKKDSEIRDVGNNIRVATLLDPFGNVFGIIENPNFKLKE